MEVASIVLEKGVIQSLFVKDKKANYETAVSGYLNNVDLWMFYVIKL